MNFQDISCGILGIDAGGTFTDFVFMSAAALTVSAFYKTPTIHYNLADTIRNGLEGIIGQIRPEAIKSVNIATTLATNAIIENKFSPTGMVLIGYDPDDVKIACKKNKFATDKIVIIPGGHDARGNEKIPLDISGLMKYLDAHAKEFESVAVSGYFSVRNPAHEIKVKETINSIWPDIYVTCGHELSPQLDAFKRAATVSINAGLIPIITNLLNSTKKVLKSFGICAPISIVRGDGSLVSSDWAELYPVETVLSGPAASAVGASYLSGATKLGRPAWVVDVGGTTTDLIYLNANGRPSISSTGVTVGTYSTLIEAVDTFTFGLGGDSRVSLNGKKKEFVIGPRRVKPLCLSVTEKPVLKNILKNSIENKKKSEPLFIQTAKITQSDINLYSDLIEGIHNGLITKDELIANGCLSRTGIKKLENMEKTGSVIFSGFTPTDALHVLGIFNHWDAEASRLGAEILSQQYGFCPENLCKSICRKVVHHIALNILRKSLLQNGCPLIRDGEAEQLILHAFSDKSLGEPQIKFNINAAIIGAGAPAFAFINEVGQLLGEKALLPCNACVAGAVGAAVSIFNLRYCVLITPMKEGFYRVHLPEGIRDFALLEEAVEHTKACMFPWIFDRAKKTGAEKPLINFVQENEIVPADAGKKIHLWTKLLFNVCDDQKVGKEK